MHRIIDQQEVCDFLARTGKRYSPDALQVELITEYGKFARFHCQQSQRILNVAEMAHYCLTQQILTRKTG